MYAILQHSKIPRELNILVKRKLSIILVLSLYPYVYGSHMNATNITSVFQNNQHFKTWYRHYILKVATAYMFWSVVFAFIIISFHSHVISLL